MLEWKLYAILYIKTTIRSISIYSKGEICIKIGDNMISVILF